MENSKHKALNQKQIRKFQTPNKFRISNFVFLFCFVFLISYFVFPKTIVYANDVSLVVSPPRFDISGKPGEIVQKTIKITNNDADRELILQAFPIDFIVQDDLGTPIKIDSSKAGKYIASPWFTLDRTEFVIPPKGTEQIVVILTIPANALPGGHYAGVFFEPVPKRGTKTTLSYTSAQVGSLFGITVPGDLKYDALIKDFSVKSPVFEFGPIDFSAEIENQSDTHITPQSSIVIYDSIGRKLTELKLDEVNIFPYTSRLLKGTWQTVWGLGRYTATLTASYGPGLVATRTLYFWIMPYRLIGAVLIVLLVTLALFVVIRRHLRHLDDHRDDEIDSLKRKIAEMENRQR